jgi:hypothetical protein
MRTDIPTNDSEKLGILRARNDHWTSNNDYLQVISTRPASILIIINVSCILEQLVKLAKIPSSH